MTVELKPNNIAEEFAPTYKKIAAKLRAQVADGSFAPGALLPSRRDLAKQFGVDVNTVQRSIKLLLDDGLLRADGWRGTFVADHVSGSKNSGLSTISPTIARTKRSNIGVIANVVPRALLTDRDVVWPEIILNAFEQALSHISDISIDFLNRAAIFDHGPTRSTFQLRRLLGRGSDAVVVIFPGLDEIAEIAAMCEAASTPLVLITPSYHVPMLVPRVTYDNVHDGYLAASHMIRRGYTNIAYFSTLEADWTHDRLEGIRQAVKASSPAVTLTVSECELHGPMLSDQQTSIAYAAAPMFLEALTPNFGVVAVNDNTAVGLLRAASERNMAVGRDFGLISFDDQPMARENGLTSLRPPLGGMGEKAAELVMQALTGATLPMQVVLQSHILPRASSMPVAKNRD